jgi:MFS family permease
MTAGGLAGLLATLPAGFITDTSRNKRAVLALLCILITLSTLLLWFSQQSSVVAVSQVVTGICAAFVGPLIAGITLGLTGQGGFSAQMGRNEAFNHGGNFVHRTDCGRHCVVLGRRRDFPADDLYHAANALCAACHSQRRYR